MKQKEKNSQPFFRRVKAYVRTPDALRLLIVAITMALCLAMFIAAISPIRYNLRIGMVPTHTIAATKDVVDEVTTERNRQQAANAVDPTYKYQENITDEVVLSLNQVFSQLSAVRQYAETLPDLSASRTFTKDELSYAHSMLTTLTLRDYQMTTLMRTPPEELEKLRTNLCAAAQNTMNGHVTEGQENAAVQSILQIIGFSTAPSVLQNIAMPVLNTYIRANMVVDQEATDAARAEAGAAVEPVIYKQGQNIVVKGEGRITSGQIAMLSALGLLSNDSFDLNIYLGGVLLTTMVLLITLLLLRRKEFEVHGNTVNTLLACIAFAVTLGLSILARMINVYLAPVALCAMLLTALVGSKTALCCATSLSILVASLAAGGNEAFSEQMVLSMVVYMGTSSLAVWLMSDKSTRLRALLTGLLMSVASSLLILSYGLMTSSNLNGALLNCAWCVGGSLISTLFYIAIQPILELAFNLPTPFKLLELSNPNQPLLKRLLLEASGTYHHSIIVANLAEAAAEAIGANPLLARVGGYYHDVGKLKRPLFFRENQIGNISGHDQADPSVSAAIITAHVRDGVALAKSYRLPQAVINIISEHHGDTPVMFFYHKAVQLAGGREVNIDDFRYEGHPPTTKESAIIMICDTIEAAVRTLKNPTLAEVENFIVKLVRGKLEDGQLSDAPLTLQDIDKICNACTTVLSGVFHERIEYPEMPEKQLRLRSHAAQIASASKTLDEMEVSLPDAAPSSDIPVETEVPSAAAAPVAPDMPADKEIITPHAAAESEIVSPQTPEETETVAPEEAPQSIHIVPEEIPDSLHEVTGPEAEPAVELPVIEPLPIITAVPVEELLEAEKKVALSAESAEESLQKADDSSVHAVNDQSNESEDPE
ncbi:MAG: HDIG domain-containing protein [Clostridia bacterium]|nr:HDIG domain-containing protein [Clostridia bacterium]